MSYSAATFQFLKELKDNNNREWFLENKKRYESAWENHLEVVAHLLKILGAKDKSIAKLAPRDCVYRIYRDVRFSKDKTPYKTHFGAYFAPDKKDYKRAGYYFHAEPGHCFLGGGMWEPQPANLKAIRQEIDYNLDEFKKILSAKAFREYYEGKLYGSALKKAPKDYPKDHPGIEYLKQKDFAAIHHFDQKIAESPELYKMAEKAWLALQPFNRFLERSLE